MFDKFHVFHRTKGLKLQRLLSERGVMSVTLDADL
jgi:hypothetical protein